MVEFPDKIFIGKIIHCDKPYRTHVLESGFIAVKDGKVIGIDHLEKLPDYQKMGQTIPTVHLQEFQILIPGLIDTHIHAFQYPTIGIGMSLPLFPWLSQIIAPLEQKFKNPEFSKTVFDAVVRKALTYGTTTASYHGTFFTDSTLILADSIISHGQRAFVGKVNVTSAKPGELVETIEESLKETKRFISELGKKNSNGLVNPTITPGSVLRSRKNDLKLLAELAKENNLRIQSHMNETMEGIKQLQGLPREEYANFTEIPEILTDKTLFAHCVHMEREEIALLADTGSAVAHCPNSNINLLSGICDLRALIQAGVKIGLGTDLSGGCSLSIINAMRCAIASSIALSFTKKDYKPIDYSEAFYLATLGGAKALAISEKVGNFEVGKEFDALIVDLDVKEGPIDVFERCSALELLQKFIYSGDDRNVVSVYVAGRKVK